jgi:hypothetical protein
MAPAEPIPCFKILDCWWEVFDVVSYLKGKVAEEDFLRLLEDRTPPNRMNSIVELVERFRERESGEEET